MPKQKNDDWPEITLALITGGIFFVYCLLNYSLWYLLVYSLGTVVIIFLSHHCYKRCLDFMEACIEKIISYLKP
jgi:hypothetical protein